jgi:hypothetical protein
MKVLRETEVSLAFDGGNNVGMLALFHAAQFRGVMNCNDG